MNLQDASASGLCWTAEAAPSYNSAFWWKGGQHQTMVSNFRERLEQAMHPRSVAIIGVSTKLEARGGANFVACYQNLGFAGRIYPVNPKVSVIRGIPVYPSILNLPEVPDLVLVSVPAATVPKVLKDCIPKGAKNVHVFSAGFDEIGEEDRIQLGHTSHAEPNACPPVLDHAVDQGLRNKHKGQAQGQRPVTARERPKPDQCQCGHRRPGKQPR